MLCSLTGWIDAYSSTIPGLIEDPVSGLPENYFAQVVYQPHPLVPLSKNGEGEEKKRALPS
jgi:hypothetical protein